MTDLKRKNVFMSASFPPREHGEKYVACDPGETADAIVYFARWILKANGTLTTAAHPMITPMLIYASRIRGVKNSLIVYRSDWFESHWIPQIDEIENDELGTVIRTKKAENQEKSLNILRHAMIQEACYAGALFIGGMADIEIEYGMFSKFSPDTLRVRVAGTGGAAASLPNGNCEAFGLDDVEQSKGYPFLADRFVETLAKIPAEANSFISQKFPTSTPVANIVNDGYDI